MFTARGRRGAAAGGASLTRPRDHIARAGGRFASVSRAARFVAAVVAVVAGTGAAGCALGGGDSPSVDRDSLETTVLHREDVPGSFASFDEGPLQMADRPRGADGWKARYRRAGSASTRGPLVIESRVDRFDDSGAAEESLRTIGRELRTGGWTSVDPPAIGDDAHAFRQREEAVTPVEYVMVVWRHANAIASVTASGFAGKVTLDEVVELARAQQRRLEAAAG